MKTSESISALAVDYINAQIELKNIAKDSQGYGYKFTSLDSILEATKPILHKHNLAILQMPITDGLISRLMHNSGEWIETTMMADMIDLAKMNQYQVIGSKITYLRRYSWTAICGIASDDDLDANAPKEKQAYEVVHVISDAQLKKVNTMMSLKNVDRDKIKAHYKIDSLKDLPVESVQPFIEYLEKL